MTAGTETRRFGEIVTTRGWVAPADVQQALAAQSELIRLGLPERIGEILRKRGLLTTEQVREVLLEQGAGPLRDLVPGYEIVERLGQGGMGAVYRARRRADDTEVALKLLPPRLGQNPEFVARFIREARAANEMRHPNIVAGLDAGCADDHYFVAMELVDGESLEQRLRRKGSLPEAEVLAIGLAIAQALGYANGQGLVHRDVKPGNILLARPADGSTRIDLNATVKLCDLGLAKWVADGGTAVTQTGLVVGTPQYVAPEQALGERDVDIRADIYSLGATLYHAATGRAPFTGGSAADVALRRLVADPTPPGEVNPRLSAGTAGLIERMLAREPGERPPVPEDVAEAIRRILRGEPSGIAPAAAAGAAGAARAGRRGGAVGLGLAATVVGALAVGSAAVAFGWSASRPAPAAAPAPAPAETPASKPAAPAPGESGESGEVAALRAEIATARAEIAGLERTVGAIAEAMQKARELEILDEIGVENALALAETQGKLAALKQRLAQLEADLAQARRPAIDRELERLAGGAGR